MPEEQTSFENAPRSSGPCIHCNLGIAEHRQDAIDQTRFVCPNWFYRRRVEIDLTRRQIALVLDSTEATIRSWETEKCAPSTAFTNAKLASAYQTSEAEITRGARVDRASSSSDSTQGKLGHDSTPAQRLVDSEQEWLDASCVARLDAARRRRAAGHDRSRGGDQRARRAHSHRSTPEVGSTRAHEWVSGPGGHRSKDAQMIETGTEVVTSHLDRIAPVRAFVRIESKPRARIYPFLTLGAAFAFVESYRDDERVSRVIPCKTPVILSTSGE
jgi:hypothetical protein